MMWSSVDGFIFDVDGTLYSQGRLRLAMLFRLLRAVITIQLSVKDIYAIYCFRKMREQITFSDLCIKDLCREVALKVKMPEDRIYETIEKWMFRVPLDLVSRFCHSDIKEFIEQQHQAGKTILIYSDYPAEDKLRAMGICYDRIFVSQTENIIGQKPSSNAMHYILNEIAISPASLVYVGDRDDKDKISAKMVNIKYYDIKEFRRIL